MPGCVSHSHDRTRPNSTKAHVDVPAHRTDPDEPALDRYVSYDDPDATVICDRSNAAAWIRSTDVRAIER